MDEPTDLDLVTDHPFEPMPGWPDSCGYQHEGWFGWACGYTRDEHADRHGPRKRLMARETYAATVEAGECKEFARLDLGEIYLWLYPQEDGTVRVETEEKY